MFAYRATVGASDGNIIAAIITNHTPRNQFERAQIGPRTGVHSHEAIRN